MIFLKAHLRLNGRKLEPMIAWIRFQLLFAAQSIGSDRGRFRSPAIFRFHPSTSFLPRGETFCQNVDWPNGAYKV